MDIERETLVALFKSLSYESVIEILTSTGSKLQNGIKLRHAFLEALSLVSPSRTKEEHCCYVDRIIPEKSVNWNTFDTLFSFSRDILSFDGKELCCQQDDMLRWREITHKLGQDLFITAFYAAHNEIDYVSREDAFAWEPTISSNDHRLNNILKREMVDNHYHLNGSTQVFPLAWCCLMNQISARGHEIQRLGRRLSPKASYDIRPDGKNTQSFYGQCIIAAALRVDLYRLNQNILKGPDLVTSRMSWWNEMLGPGTSLHPELITDGLQRDIEALKQRSTPFGTPYEKHFLDYLLDKSTNHAISYSPYCALVGERRFLFFCLQNIYNGHYSFRQQMAFHLYLLLKGSVRDELIQTNTVKGLQNFIEYEQRKELFIESYPQYQHEKIQLAVNAPLQANSNKLLELRLCPKDSAQKNQFELKRIEDVIESHKDSTRYVLHFPRGSDAIPSEVLPGCFLKHGWLRKITMQKAVALLAFIEGYPLAGRLAAIDACANEIGCRPDVLAPVFRRIKFCSALKATYHAGESFYDIVDGLRAIDEALSFCALEKGDRIGHGVALGLDAKAFYQTKHNSLILPKQDLLDNIVWTLAQWDELAYHNVSLKSDLEGVASRLIGELYPASLPDIATYFKAWQLRGDAPEYYRVWPTCASPDKTMEVLLHFPIGGAKYAISPFADPALRLDRAVWSVVHEYLYSAATAKAGAVPELFKIRESFVETVFRLQKRMRMKIANKGIGIEANPSSNLLIGPVENYVSHPIFVIFPMSEEVQYAERISISINTDDQGIFDTSLENEYALLACAIKKMNYSDQEIYTWIDKVRKMGVDQVFPTLDQNKNLIEV